MTACDFSPKKPCRSWMSIPRPSCIASMPANRRRKYCAMSWRRHMRFTEAILHFVTHRLCSLESMRLIERGDLNFDDYLRTLAEIGYSGTLTIEREIPKEPARQRAEIAAAIELLEDLKHKMGVE
jgi:hypothetical protein